MQLQACGGVIHYTSKHIIILNGDYCLEILLVAALSDRLLSLSQELATIKLVDMLLIL